MAAKRALRLLNADFQRVRIEAHRLAGLGLPTLIVVVGGSTVLLESPHFNASIKVDGGIEGDVTKVLRDALEELSKRVERLEGTIALLSDVSPDHKMAGS